MVRLYLYSAVEKAAFVVLSHGDEMVVLASLKLSVT